MGQKILLRLRPAWAADTFLPEEDIIHTMLHEVLLCYRPRDSGAELSTFRSSHIMSMDPTIRTFTTSYLVSKKNTTSSSVPDMQTKAFSQMGVEWVLVYPKAFPRSSRSNVRSKPPSGSKTPVLPPVREALSDWAEEILQGWEAGTNATRIGGLGAPLAMLAYSLLARRGSPHPFYTGCR